MSGLRWRDVTHAGVRGGIATLLLIPCGLWAAGSYDVMAAGYAFAIMHYQTVSLAVLPPLVAFLGLLAIPAALVERRYGDRDSAKQHATLLGLTALVTVIGLLVVVVQASYAAALWQVGLTGGWEAAAERLGELLKLMKKLPVDTLLLCATFTTPYLVVGTLRTHDAWYGRLLFSATTFSALLAALMYMSVAPETQRLAWITQDAPTIGRPRLIATWGGLVGGLAFLLALSALVADRVAPAGEDAQP